MDVVIYFGANWLRNGGGLNLGHVEGTLMQGLSSSSLAIGQRRERRKGPRKSVTGTYKCEVHDFWAGRHGIC